MKRILGWMAFTVLLFAGCQKEEEQNGGTDGSMVRISLQAPEVMGTTRTGAGYTNSAKGGLTNVNWNEYDLRYQLAVYDKDGKVQVVEPIVKTVQDGYTGINFEVSLVNHREYKFVAWADFVRKGTVEDLHYKTDDLTGIHCVDGDDKQLNDESRDAYFITINKEVDATKGVELTLRRPFAKVRIVTTDWFANSDANTEVYMPDNFKVTYRNCKRFTCLNAVTGVAESSDAQEVVYTVRFDKNEKDYSAGYDASDKNRTLVVDYLLANSEQEPIHFKFEALDGTEIVSAYDFTTNVPIQRDFLTTLLGNMLTEKTSVTISCDENFEEEFNDYDNNNLFEVSKPEFVGDIVYIKTAGELVWLSKNALTNGAYENDEFNIRKTGANGYIFEFVNDIDLKGVDWDPINWWPGDDTGNKHGYFDGKGHTIRNLKIDGENSKSQGLFGTTTIDVKNLTIENASFNNISSFTGTIAGNSYGDFENCTVKHVFIRAYNYYTTHPSAIRIGGMVGIHNGGNMTNCTADDVNVKGYHSVGGLAGFVNESPNRQYENCTVTNSSLWNVALIGSGLKQIGAIVGAVGVKTTFKNCKSSDMEYKIYKYNFDEEKPIILHSGEENGGALGYGPVNEIYGYSTAEVVIEE